DHADAAVAVRAIARRRRVAQVRQLDAVAPRRVENALAGRRFDLAAVEGEFNGRGLVGHGITRIIFYQLPRGVLSSSGKYLSTHSSGLGAAWPRPQIEASRIAVESSVSSAPSHGPDAISIAAFSVPTRHGVHWPQLSSSKNFMRLSATAFISSWSDRITTAWEPTKQPYFSRVPKSSGRSAMLAGKIPPEAPPGR